MPNRAETLKQKFLQSIGLPFREVLPESVISSVLQAEGVKYYNSVYSPVVTLWAFLSQVLDPDKSLRNTVSRVIAWLSEADQKIPSSDTGAYSKARGRLPEGVVKQLLKKTAQSLDEQALDQALWCGRRVRICDGSSVLMSDTPENQGEKKVSKNRTAVFLDSSLRTNSFSWTAVRFLPTSCYGVYPQHSNQRVGCGFPIAKIVVMFSLVTGTLMAGLIEAFNTSELVMARQLYRMLSPGDVALADQAFGTYVDGGARAVCRSRCGVSQTQKTP